MAARVALTPVQVTAAEVTDADARYEKQARTVGTVADGAGKHELRAHRFLVALERPKAHARPIRTVNAAGVHVVALFDELEAHASELASDRTRSSKASGRTLARRMRCR
jgi:hypothetical protein